MREFIVAQVNEIYKDYYESKYTFQLKFNDDRSVFAIYFYSNLFIHHVSLLNSMIFCFYAKYSTFHDEFQLRAHRRTKKQILITNRLREMQNSTQNNCEHYMVF